MMMMLVLPLKHRSLPSLCYQCRQRRGPRKTPRVGRHGRSSKSSSLLDRTEDISLEPPRERERKRDTQRQPTQSSRTGPLPGHGLHPTRSVVAAPSLHWYDSSPQPNKNFSLLRSQRKPPSAVRRHRESTQIRRPADFSRWGSSAVPERRLQLGPVAPKIGV